MNTFKRGLFHYRVMILSCIKCGVKFEDSYNDLNELNKRVWCNSCTQEEWDLKKLKGRLR